jgi:hypothetical protein
LYEVLSILFADRELIPARDANLAAMQGFASGSIMFVTNQRENICPSKKEMKKAVTMLPYFLVFTVRL